MAFLIKKITRRVRKAVTLPGLLWPGTPFAFLFLEDAMIKIELGYCQCGCGNLAPIAKRTDRKCGHVKGKPIRFICGHNGNLLPTREGSRLWKGGVIVNKVHHRTKIYNPEHHRADKNGYVFRSIIAAEKALGKRLPNGAVVHHHNGNSMDDRNENLVICENKAYHMFLHKRIRAYKACGNSSWRKCRICKKYDSPENMYIHKIAGCVHRSCSREMSKIYHLIKKSAQETC